MLEKLSSLAHIATAFGVVFAACQLFLNHKQSVTKFEDSLAKEYRAIIAKLPTKALLGESLSNREHAECLDDFYRYFDLCNEQVFLHESGRVSDETWEFWRDGITSNLKRPAFGRAWIEISSRANGDFSELRKLFPPPIFSEN